MAQANTVLAMGVACVISACASSKTGHIYSRDETRQVQTIQMGTVESSRPVKIEGTKSGIGAGAGTIAGAIAGGSTGQGNGSALGSVIGAVAGGLAGAVAEEAVTRENGIEITIRLDNGLLISVVQAEDEQFLPGDRVRILQGWEETRVTH